MADLNDKKINLEPPVDQIDKDDTANIKKDKKIIGDLVYADFEKAIRECKGMLTIACDDLKISVMTMKSVLQKNKSLRRDFEEYRERHLDLAEFALLQKVQDGNLDATKYYLSKLGVARGYGEKVQSKGGKKLSFSPAVKKVKNDKNEKAGSAGGKDGAVRGKRGIRLVSS